MSSTIRSRLMPLAGFLLAMAFLVTCPQVFASCENSLGLEGTVFVEICAPEKDDCVEAESVLHDYVREAGAKVAENTLVLSVYASPWHLYGPGMRILTIEEMAENAKKRLTPAMSSILLLASWTGVTPDPNSKSIAQKLSDALDGFPVTGMDGFLWIAKDGSLRTTHQAFTAHTPARHQYGIRPGDEVMESLIAGQYVWFEETFIEKRQPLGVRLAAAGWDIFMLCPDRALESFEAAARLRDPIATYDAAIIRLNRGKEGDREAAIKLLSQAAKLGDKPAQSRLRKLTGQGR